MSLSSGHANAPLELKPAIRQRIESVQTNFTILDLSSRAAQTFGILKKKLRDARKLTERGSRYHNIDLMLAATAVVESCTLVSSDSLYHDLHQLEPDFRYEIWNRL